MKQEPEDLSALHALAEALYNDPKDYAGLLTKAILATQQKTPEFIYTVSEIERAFSTCGDYADILEHLEERAEGAPGKHERRGAEVAGMLLRLGKLTCEQKVKDGTF